MSGSRRSSERTSRVRHRRGRRGSSPGDARREGPCWSDRVPRRRVPCSLAAPPTDVGASLTVVNCPACTTEAAPQAQFCASCGSALPREAGEDPYLGQVVARKYRVEKLLGEGGMGRVYRANQLVLEKPVVLKLLHPTLQKDARTVARFQREAKAASRL